MAEPLGPGERAERARARRYWLIFGGMALLGAIAGGILGFLHDDAEGALTAGGAIALTLCYLIGLAIGTWLFFRQTDEVDLRDNLLAGSVAIYFYATVYPSWFLLWKGGVVGEPDHELLFIGTLAVLTLAYVWKKIRP